MWYWILPILAIIFVRVYRFLNLQPDIKKLQVINEEFSDI